MKKFNIGDIVEFDEDINGFGEIVEISRYDEAYLVKLQGRLRGKGHNGNGIAEKVYPTNDYWWVRMGNKTLKLADPKQSIHITTEGNITHAVLKDGDKITKRAIAKCSPRDVFDFEIGAKIAIKRLFMI